LVQVAVGDLAGFSVINSVAVAQIQAVGRAKAPDRVLHEAREYPWKARIEGASINPICGGSNDPCTASLGVAGRAIPMGFATTLQSAGAVQQIVDQRVNGDHYRSGLEPNGPVVARSDQ